MINAQFHIRLPENVWVADLSRQFPDTTFRLISGRRDGEVAIELGEVVGDDPEAVVEATRDHPSIEEYDLLESTGRRAVGKYTTSDTDLYEFADTSSLTIEFPVVVTNGWYEFQLTGTREELNTLQEVLEESPLPYRLNSLVSTTTAETLLTERQRELLEAAVREGYLEVPRECTLAELAESVGVDKSSASTVLRRGEGQIIKWFLSGPERKRRESP
ncbi:bacterio-opsin activator [Halobacteriales archaeon QH_2_65_14]|nr:MAG: bacterio-opsin activator [Halobacteriales archaeon QH_2_65_14]